MNNLENKVAVITGAGSGIGRAIASAFHQEKVKLVLNSRNESRLNEVAGRCDAVSIAGDITEKEIQNKLLETAIKTYGKCDILVNNAGIIEVGPVEEIDLEKIAAMVRVNIEATFRLTYLFLKEFKAKNSGHIVNISSVMGTKVRPTAGAYAGTKFAVEALSEALRMELAGTGVKISCIEPGLVMTELHRDWETHPSVSMGIHHPLQPEYIAEQVVYILNQPEHVSIPKMMVLPSDHQI